MECYENPAWYPTMQDTFGSLVLNAGINMALFLELLTLAGGGDARLSA